jgi:hypothetical protein
LFGFNTHHMKYGHHCILYLSNNAQNEKLDYMMISSDLEMHWIVFYFSNLSLVFPTTNIVDTMAIARTNMDIEPNSGALWLTVAFA